MISPALLLLIWGFIIKIYLYLIFDPMASQIVNLKIVYYNHIYKLVKLSQIICVATGHIENKVSKFELNCELIVIRTLISSCYHNKIFLKNCKKNINWSKIDVVSTIQHPLVRPKPILYGTYNIDFSKTDVVFVSFFCLFVIILHWFWSKLTL